MTMATPSSKVSIPTALILLITNIDRLMYVFAFR